MNLRSFDDMKGKRHSQGWVGNVMGCIRYSQHFQILYLDFSSSSKLKKFEIIESPGISQFVPLGQVKNLHYTDFPKFSKVGSIPSPALETLPKELQMAYDFGEMVMSESSLSMKWLGVSQVQSTWYKKALIQGSRAASDLKILT